MVGLKIYRSLEMMQISAEKDTYMENILKKKDSKRKGKDMEDRMRPVKQNENQTTLYMKENHLRHR